MARLIDGDALLETIEDHVTTVSCCPTVDWSMGKTQMKKQVIEDIRNAPTIGGWISVKDRLPEKNQIVIASDGEHTWDVGMYKSLCGKPSEWNWKKNTVKTVLWWMPKDGALPEPPET